MKTYLSIDLDYWNQGKNSFPHMQRFLRLAKETVSKKNLKIVDSHEELLPHVNKSGCDNLINVDWHSDVSNRFDSGIVIFNNHRAWKKLNCGTWVSFVKFRKTGKFTWIHPYRVTATSARGYCHYPHASKHNPFIKPELGGWNNLIQEKSKTPESFIDWSTVTHIGICYSFDWVKHEEIWELATDVLGFRPKRNPRAKLGY